MRKSAAPYMLICLFFVACTATETPSTALCDLSMGGIILLPTATRPNDPDLFQPPQPQPTNGGSDCSPGGAFTPLAANVPTQFVTTEIVNLSLDNANQDLAATAVGDDMLAVAWISNGDIYIALTRGGNHFQVRRVDRGQDVSLAFSRINRLHVAYEQDGVILYRAADQGTHPADSDPILVAEGQDPSVVVDELNWAHILYEQDDSIFKAKHLSGDQWLSRFVAYGTNPSVIPFYNEKELVLWGNPTNTAWFGLFMAAPYNGEIRIFRYLSWFNVWEQVAAFPIPPNEQLTGHFDGLSASPVGLDYLARSEDEVWVYAAWVAKRPSQTSSQPVYTQPLFEAVNPLFPNALANADHIHAALNAVRWHSQVAFDAGLKQTFTVSDTNSTLTFDAWGLVDAANGADLTLRVGIDPTGGDNPDSPDVVWSTATAPDVFTHFSVNTPAVSDTATVFLHATMTSSGVEGTAVWDSATVQTGASTTNPLVNGDFEGAFDTQNGIAVPEGWTAYYQDSGANAPGGRDVYTLYAAWSENGGGLWTDPATITANHDLTVGTTGALRPDVFPLISTATEPPSVSFFTIYERGNPPPDTNFLRFGRPMMTQCELGTTTCTQPPGLPLLPPAAVRPSINLRVTADPFNPDRALLTWDALQTDFHSKDVYATYLVLR
ncbi:MAG: hypothetical protein GY943_28640 [Chloroflexi bacterium]|nr:hypothetical protein [Chloroflexota bacterium]